MIQCGYTIHSNGFTFVCSKQNDHPGYHEARTELRDRTEKTLYDDKGEYPGTQHRRTSRWTP